MTRFVVLLRGVNVGGRTLPMAALRAAARAGGFPDCETYIASGNLLLSAMQDGAAVEGRIEALIAAEFGIAVPAVARSAAELAATAASNPFPDASPKLLHLCLTKHPPHPDTADTLAARLLAGERVAVAGGALWIDFAGGVAGSKLTSAALDKAAGSTLTARNWNTVTKLVTLAAV